MARYVWHVFVVLTIGVILTDLKPQIYRSSHLFTAHSSVTLVCMLALTRSPQIPFCVRGCLMMTTVTVAEAVAAAEAAHKAALEAVEEEKQSVERG